MSAILGRFAIARSQREVTFICLKESSLCMGMHFLVTRLGFPEVILRALGVPVGPPSISVLCICRLTAENLGRAILGSLCANRSVTAQRPLANNVFICSCAEQTFAQIFSLKYAVYPSVTLFRFTRTLKTFPPRVILSGATGVVETRRAMAKPSDLADSLCKVLFVTR